MHKFTNIDLLEKLISSYSYDLTIMRDKSHLNHDDHFVLMYRNCRFVSSVNNPKLKLGFLSALVFSAKDIPTGGELNKYRDSTGALPVAIAYDAALQIAIETCANALAKYEALQKRQKK